MSDADKTSNAWKTVADGGNCRGKGVEIDQRFNFGVVQDVGDFFRIKHQVDRYNRGGGFLDADVERDEDGAVYAVESDVIPRLNSAGDQPGCDAVRKRVEFGVGKGLMRIGNG